MHINKNSSLFDTKNWIILPEVNSTNTFAKEVLAKSKPIINGTVILAVNQTEGRGQMGHHWISEAGQNLTFSILLETAFLPISQQFKLNQAICLGLLDFLKSFNIPSPSIKWPNDIYIKERKVGGILIENTLAGDQHKYSIIGIGLNINQKQFPESLSRATSLFLEKNREYEKEKVLEFILEKMEARISQLISTQYFILMEDFDRNLLGLDQTRVFKQEDLIFKGNIKGTNSKGELIMVVEGKEKEFGKNELIFLF